MDGFAVTAGPAGARCPSWASRAPARPATQALGDGEAIADLDRRAAARGRRGGRSRSSSSRVGRRRRSRSTTTSAPAQRPRGRRGPRGRRDRAAPGHALGPAELGVAVEAGRGELRCRAQPARGGRGHRGRAAPSPATPLGPGADPQLQRASRSRRWPRRPARACSPRPGADDTAADTEDGARRSRWRRRTSSSSPAASRSGRTTTSSPRWRRSACAGASGASRCAPGKPTWFGDARRPLVFGLPGNPVSAMVTFLLFARPALHALQGAAVHAAPRRACDSRGGRAPARPRRGVRVRWPPPGRRCAPRRPARRSSHILSSMIGADGLAIVAGPGEGGRGPPVERRSSRSEPI